MQQVEFRVRRRVWVAWFAGSVLGLGLFAWIARDADGIIDRATGVFGLIFFGAFAALSLLRWLGARNHGFVVSRSGLSLESIASIHAPMPLGRRVLIPWDHVDRIGVAEIEGQEYTTLRLHKYDAILAQINPAESRRQMWLWRTWRTISYVTAGLATLRLTDPSKFFEHLSGSGKVHTPSDLLTFTREKYGAEIFIGSVERDRSAQDFADYLERWRSAAPPRADRLGNK